MRCPECNKDIKYVWNDIHISGKPKKKVIYRPLRNENGTINWGNAFYMNIEILIIIIAIILLLIGVRQINDQCYDILEEPCKFIDLYHCTGGYASQPLGGLNEMPFATMEDTGQASK